MKNFSEIGEYNMYINSLFILHTQHAFLRAKAEDSYGRSLINLAKSCEGKYEIGYVSDYIIISLNKFALLRTELCGQLGTL
jgi:hypothetical protein